jgi:hypothetical protein
MKGEARCRGCGTGITWARHIATGKMAPLVLAKEGEKPNIYAAPVPPDMVWTYRIATSEDAVEAIQPAYLNHFSNCPKAKRFKGKSD